MNYFSDNWNCFDFVIVLASWLPYMFGGLNFGAILPILRLLRLLRVMKLFKALPQLRILIEAVIEGFGSITCE